MRTTFLDYDARRKPKTPFFCIACQKDMDPTKGHRVVWMVDGDCMVVHPDDVPQVSDLNCWPIGDDCARTLGLDWSRPVVPAL